MKTLWEKEKNCWLPALNLFPHNALKKASLTELLKLSKRF